MQKHSTERRKRKRRRRRKRRKAKVGLTAEAVKL